MRAAAKADPENIRLWGHSMGGGIVMRVLVIDPQIKAGLLYAAVHADERKISPIFARMAAGMRNARRRMNHSAESRQSVTWIASAPRSAFIMAIRMSACHTNGRVFSMIGYLIWVKRPLMIYMKLSRIPSGGKVTRASFLIQSISLTSTSSHQPNLRMVYNCPKFKVTNSYQAYLSGVLNARGRCSGNKGLESQG